MIDMDMWWQRLDHLYLKHMVPYLRGIMQRNPLEVLRIQIICFIDCKLPFEEGPDPQ